MMAPTLLPTSKVTQLAPEIPRQLLCAIYVSGCGRTLRAAADVARTNATKALSLASTVATAKAGRMARQGRQLAAIDPGLAEGNRRLAAALRSLRLLLAPGTETLTVVAHQASRDCNRERLLSTTTVSRYFSGQVIAPGWFICWLHEKAQQGGHGTGHPPALEDLLTLQRLAKKPTDCASCNKLIKELSRSDAELLRAKSRGWHLARALSACRDASRRVAFKAGAPDRSSAPRWQRAHLPVPRYRQDRQDELKDLEAAQAVAAQVKALASDQKHHEVTATLQHARAVLSPVETAALVVVLRSGEVHGVAETLLQGYARDLPAHAVMGLACVLLQHDLLADAEAVLLAATSEMRPAGPTTAG